MFSRLVGPKGWVPAAFSSSLYEVLFWQSAYNINIALYFLPQCINGLEQALSSLENRTGFVPTARLCGLLDNMHAHADSSALHLTAPPQSSLPCYPAWKDLVFRV